MANLIPLAIADLELQLASAISVGATSFTLSSSNDDDGNAIPAGQYCFTIDSGTSNKEYLIGQVNGTAVTSVKSVSRQGVETTGAARAHRIGAPCILTDFATIQRVADILRGQLALDGANPIVYDAEPTLADRKELATVGYVLDTVSGGTVAFDSQVISGNAGESIVAGTLVYFKTSDQEWYKTDADTAATVEGVQLGIALGTGSDGVAISGGIQISGTWTTTGLTAGALYYASNTAGAIATSAGTTSQVIGFALSTTKLLIIPRNPQLATTREKDAMAGGGDFGTPSTSNKFLTEILVTSRQKIDIYTSNDTWTKPTGCKFVDVLVVGGGGGGSSGGVRTDDNASGGAGGGGGGVSFAKFNASNLTSTVSITVGTGGTGGTGVTASSNTVGNNGSAGNTSSFGTYLTASGGTGGQSTSTGAGSIAGTGGGGLISTGSAGGVGGIGSGSPAAGVSSTYGSTGGGGGSSSNLAGSTSNAAAGGAITPYISISGGAAGLSTPTAGGVGNSLSGNFVGGTGGGGGGGELNGTASSGGNGAVGGGGGGGGAACRSAGSVTSGAGGNGGNGVVVVISYL